MQIGSRRLNNNVLVAPMAGVTDRPFARKHVSWYLGPFPDDRALRHDVNRAQTADAQLGLAGRFFDALECDTHLAA